MQRRVSNDFDSNCLLAVLWLKIRHWRTVKIMHRSAFANYRKYGVFALIFTLYTVGWSITFIRIKRCVSRGIFGCFVDIGGR